MEEAILKRIGLTGGEVKVYLALLGLGQSPVGPIIKKSGVSSSKIYVILDRLAGKGLVTHATVSGKKQFKVSSPKKVFDMLGEKRAELQKQEGEFRKILPALLKREQARAKPNEAEIFEGYGGIKAYFNGLLDGMKGGGERLVFGARPGYPVSEPGQRFFQNYHRRWVSAGLKTRIIFNRELRGSRQARFFERQRLTQVRYLPQNTMSSVGIQKEGIDILIWTARQNAALHKPQSAANVNENAMLFVIKSREVADSFREYFEVLWRTAKR